MDNQNNQKQYDLSDQAPQVQTPMKWFKFLIYFSLFAGALLNVSTGFRYLSGAVYDQKDVVYEVFDKIKTYDTVMAIAIFVGAAISIYARFVLASYSSKSKYVIMIPYLYSGVVSLVYKVFMSSYMKEVAMEAGVYEQLKQNIDPVFTSGIFSIIVGVALAAVNYIYFNERSHIFVN